MNNFLAAAALIVGALAINVAFLLITMLSASNEVKCVLWIVALAVIITVAVRSMARRIDF